MQKHNAKQNPLPSGMGSIKRLILVFCVALTILLVAVGCTPQDPIDDLYTTNVYPKTTDTYAVGSAALRYNNGYFKQIFLNGVLLVPGIVVETDPLFAANGVVNTRTVNGHALNADVIVTKGDVGLGLVENTALSTWAGSANITTLGTVTTGTLSGITIQGVISAGTGLTMPAFTAGGAIDINSQNLTNVTAINPAQAVDTTWWSTTVGTGRVLRLAGTNAASGAGNVSDSPTLAQRATYRTAGDVLTYWESTALLDMTAGGAAPASNWDFSINSVLALRLTSTNGAISTKLNGGIFTVDSATLYGNSSGGASLMRHGSGALGDLPFRFVGDTNTGITSQNTADTLYLVAGGTAALTLVPTAIKIVAGGKVYPTSGVASFSVVSTALTLGSAGSMIIPVANMTGAANDAARDVLAGNVDGAIVRDSGGDFLWARQGGLWKKAVLVAP